MIKQRSDFQIDISEPFLSPLVEQLIAIDLGTELFDVLGGSNHKTMSVILWISDDVNSMAMSALRAHLKSGNIPFKLSCRAGKDLYVFEGAHFTALQHSIFTREDHSEKLELKRGTSEPVHGVLFEPTSRKYSAKLVQVTFSSFEHYIMDSIQ